jgi:glycosyltransferase involved in cell wall biosynthesis
MLRAVHDAAVQRGWSFEVIFTHVAAERPWYRDLKADGIAARVAPDVSRRALAAWLASVVTEGNDSTVLHTHFTSFDLPTVTVARGRANTIVVWHLHTPLESSVGMAIRNVLKFAVFGRGAETILCVSADLCRAARRRLASTRRLVVFPNAVDLERFHRATQQERSRARAELGIPDGRPVLVHFGWDWDRKGGDLFLAAVDELSRSGMALMGLCVGGGEPARARSAGLGLDDLVCVVEPRDDVGVFYAAADVFVSPSAAEGMPYAVLEALCMGTPAVISNIPSHAPLAEGTVGCMLAQENPQAFAEAIRSVLSGRAENGLDVQIADFANSLDLRTWARRLIDLYAEWI